MSKANGHHPAFTLVRSVPIEALNLSVDEYRHDKTGARHYHLATDDEQNVFLVGLRTVPEDSTGVAHILEHERYEIVSERQVPGRQYPTTRVGVTLTIDGEVYPDVSFVTVRTEEGRWMVQEVDVERITGQ